jgi:hypothetical protein
MRLAAKGGEHDRADAPQAEQNSRDDQSPSHRNPGYAGS